MSCNDKKKFTTSEASTKASLRTKGAIDAYLNILDSSLFRKLNKEWSSVAKEKFGVTGNLFSEENDKAIANKQAFKQIDNAKGINYQLESDTESSLSSPQTIALVNDFLGRIGVNTESVKKIVVNGIRVDANAVANITQSLIQVVEGKESRALTEEAMHFTVEILEQKDPKLFNQLLKEINDYALLKDVMAEYSTNPLYQTADGKPDIRKLKKEAIAKVLAETVINQNEGSTEKPELLAKVESWWSEILNFLKGLFVTSGFDSAAMKVLSGEAIGTVADIRAEEGSMFLQKTKQEQIFDSIKEMSSKITKPEEDYYIDGRKIGRRVSNLVADWYERRFKSNDLTKSEFQKAVDDLKAEKGTAGHADFEHAFEVFVDENGFLRDEPLDDSGYVSQINPANNDMYELLKSNLKDRLNSFPKENGGTRFMSEATIYDAQRDIAGTVDFLAVTPEGKVSILDWKFMDLNTDKYTDIPWYKVNAWNTQMDQYKYIIGKTYNVKNENFEQTRMIPIKAVYTKANAKTGALPKLLNIKIGDVNVKNIKEDYLLPVGLEAEKTGNKKIDVLLEKLNAIYKKLSEEKVLPSDKLNKAEQLNALFSAIRQLQMKQNVAPLLYQAKVLNKQIQGILDRYKSEFEGKDAKSFTADQISDFAESIETAREALGAYTKLDTELRFLFAGELSEEDKKLKEDLRDTVDNAREYEDLLKDVDEDFTNDIIAGSENVKNLSTPEKIVRGMSKLFGNTATLQLKGLEVLFKKANKAFAFAGMDTLTEVKRLTDIKDAYQKWASGKGLTNSNMFGAIQKQDANELIDEFNPEFYSTLKKKIQDQDFKWIKENVDVDAYKKHIEEKKKEEISRISNKPRIGTDAQNAFEIKRELSKVNDLYNITTPTGIGWLLYDDIKNFPNRQTWESEQWKELIKPENKPAKDFYDYIKERNEYYKEIGYINAKQARTFLPWVRKGLSEKLVFGGKISIGEQFLRNISVDEGDVGYGKIDPLTGKPIDSIPIYLTKELDSDYSTDLFKTMAMYNEFAIKFKYLSEIEAQGRALIRLEQNKKAIATSMFGKTQYKDGVIQYTPDNNENAKIIEDMVKAIVYQQKYIESETFDQMLGKLGNFGGKLNKALGRDIFPDNLEGRQVSINKVITQMNNTFQVATLGLNVLSSASNLFGGKTQSLINSGKYFTKKDYIASEMWLLANKMGGSDKQKMLAALDYFIPFTENYNRDAATKLSLNKLDDQAIQDWLMILMREGERSVQVTNFFAFINNSIVENGEVVNAREFLRATPEYQNFYSGTQEERNARSEKFEKDVKELVEKQGVLNLGSVVDDKFVIPGVEQKSESVVETRRKIQQFTSDALGNLTEENKRIINMTIYGNSFMVFKNWIPRLVDVRMGNLKYNSASDAYEWGRSRMMFRMISEDLLGSMRMLKNSMIGVTSDKDLEAIRKLYEKKKSDYETDTGKDLDMTEDEFIDLVRQNIKNQIADTLTYAALFALALGLKALAPDDDEDPFVKNQYKFLLKATDKFKDELGYFYNPTSLTGLVSTGIFPAMGLVENYEKAVVNFMKENYAIATGNEELEDKNNVIKYWMKSFPISSQIAGMLPMFYPNMAKDLGLKMQSQYGMR